MADKMYWSQWGLPIRTRDDLLVDTVGEAYHPLVGSFSTGEDRISLRLHQTAMHAVEFVLSAGRGMWWKSVKVLSHRNRGHIQAECQTEGDDNWSSIARLDYPSPDDVLVLAKAKMFGIHTDMYEIPLRELNGGNIDGIRFTFSWVRDA